MTNFEKIKRNFAVLPDSKKQEILTAMRDMEFTDGDRQVMSGLAQTEEDWKKYLDGPVREEKK